jgi:peroxiredoxin
LAGLKAAPANQQEKNMTIKVGDKVPSGTFMEMKDGKPTPVTTDDLFKGKKVIFFALPGAFTPTCSAKHVLCSMPAI